MPKLSEEFLDQLRNSCEVEQVIGEYVALKRRGKILVGLCPFHGEKTASFTVYPETQSYYCFGCGAGGNVINFISKIENLDYLDSVRMLAERCGIAMPELRENNDEEYLQIRKQILEINKAAANFFYKSLRTEQGKDAVAYIQKRKLTAETVKKYALGYAPKFNSPLCAYLKSQGFSLEIAKEAGLCRVNQQGEYYDVFRHRLMFPIVDVRGNVIAFGGRRIDDNDNPKYYNSPETKVFNKSKNLFSLNFAKGVSRQLILAEGYMDVIALNQGGFTNAVATLGTALTGEQASLIARYADEVVICYDADGAGKKATDRAIDILGKTGVKIRILRIPGAKDPDEFIRENGADAFRALLNGSGNQTDYRLNDARAKYQLDKPDERLSYLKDCVKILAEVSSPIERDMYAGRLANELEITKNAILAEISTMMRFARKGEERKELSEEQNRLLGRDDRINTEKKRALPAAKAEEYILCTLFYNHDLYAPISMEIKEDDFVTSFNRKLFSVFMKVLSDGAVLDSYSLGEYLDESEMGAVQAILSKRENDITDMDSVLKCASILREYHARRQLKESATIDAKALENYIKNMDK